MRTLRPSRLCLPLLLSMVSACQAPGPAPVADPDAIAGSWIWLGQPGAGGRQPTLSLDRDGAMHGNGGINSFRGRLDLAALAEGRWKVGALASTKKGGTMPAMDAEKRFLGALAQAQRAELANGELRLLADGVIVARFERLRAR